MNITQVSKHIAPNKTQAVVPASESVLWDNSTCRDWLKCLMSAFFYVMSIDSPTRKLILIGS